MKNVAHMVDAADEGQRHAVRPRDRLQIKPGRHPDEAIGSVPIVHGRRRAGEALERVGETTDSRADQGSILILRSPFSQIFVGKASNAPLLLG